MPYQFDEDLPSSVRLLLPEGAQDICRAAFNSVFDSHDGQDKKKSRTGSRGPRSNGAM
ncbi:MAG TPA: ChaB family protein [Methylocella sp.]|nr:ChaB family protein [Methylocella sp.]